MPSLNIYYQNVRGLRTKTNNFFRNVCLNSYDVIVITETWLVDSINSCELFDGRYLVWRRDRDYTRTLQKLGGGVLIAVRKDLVAMERYDWRSSTEDIWITITLKKLRPSVTYYIHICGLYLCKENSGSSFNTQLLNFTHNLNNLMSSYPLDVFIIMGDFNFGNDVKWCKSPDGAELVPEEISDSSLVEFFDCVSTYSLSQFNGIRNVNGRMLDLVFSNSTLTVEEIDNALAVPVDVHHKTLHIQANFIQFHTLHENSTKKYMFNKGDYECVNNALIQVDWHDYLCSVALDEAVTRFYEKLYEIRDKFIPVKSVRRQSYPPWYNTALIKILAEKHKYHSKYKRYGNLSDYHSFSLLKMRAEELEQTCFNNYIDIIEASIVSNPRSFWSYVKSKKCTFVLPNIMRYGETVAETGQEITNLFADYFHATFQQPDSDLTSTQFLNDHDVNISISSIEISSDRVLKLLKSLDINKSGGPDLIPPIFIVKCAESLLLPVCTLFKRSLSEGTVPNIWKSAFITPVFKSGDKADVSNYRPISKLCLFAKILERIVHTEVYSVLASKLGDSQHGF
ncbi:uncharacterized protein LOC119189460 [Manduca sexta]|uniref:uncharacterized protein LOC119189460 n=1 Tax=Manduca sexta TaxID=7130 RepID=UPI00188F4D0F|nr:uncharacterized protein LOC119189460 [Manduca sexta]